MPRLQREIDGRCRQRLLHAQLVLLVCQMAVSIGSLGLCTISAYQLVDYDLVLGGPTGSKWPLFLLGAQAILTFLVTSWGCVAFLQLRAVKTARDSISFAAFSYELSALICAVGCVCCAGVALAFGLAIDPPVRHNLEMMMKEYASPKPSPDVVAQVNNVQQTFACCGISSSEDEAPIRFWLDNPQWQRQIAIEQHTRHMDHPLSNDSLSVPWSCCDPSYIGICYNLEFKPHQDNGTNHTHPFHVFEDDCATNVCGWIYKTVSIPVCSFQGVLALLFLGSAFIGRLLETSTTDVLERGDQTKRLVFNADDCKSTAFVFGKTTVRQRVTEPNVN